MATAPATDVRVLTPGQMKDLSSALVQAVPSDLPFGVAESALKRKGEVGEDVRAILSGPKKMNWRLAYLVLGMYDQYMEFAKTRKDDDNGNWTVPVVKGVTCNKVVEALRKIGVNMYLYVEDLDSEVTVNDRDPANGSYAVSFQPNIEADEKFKRMSANQLKAQNHKGITLLERLLLELGYFLATGRHLDVENITLCTGSRDQDGFVPGVYFGSDCRELSVRW